MKSNNKGFSLVELIIVIAIMAILVGFLAPQLIKYIEKSNVSSDAQMLDAVYDAVVFASVDQNVMEDPNSSAILNNMAAGTIKLEDLRNPTGNRFCQEVISTLGWSDLNPSTYREMLRSAHASDATIYFTYKGDFNNPLIMWITTTDASGNKDTTRRPTSCNESDAALMEEIRSCIHIE